MLPQCPDDTRSAGRRLANVYLPVLAGSPAALDFAGTAPERQETLAKAIRETAAAAADYARHKKSHLNTAQCCEAQGIVFVPMVVKSTGTWDKEKRSRTTGIYISTLNISMYSAFLSFPGTWDKGAEVILKHLARAVAVGQVCGIGHDFTRPCFRNCLSLAGDIPRRSIRRPPERALQMMRRVLFGICLGPSGSSRIGLRPIGKRGA